MHRQAPLQYIQHLLCQNGWYAKNKLPKYYCCIRGNFGMIVRVFCDTAVAVSTITEWKWCMRFMSWWKYFACDLCTVSSRWISGAQEAANTHPEASAGGSSSRHSRMCRGIPIYKACTKDHIERNRLEIIWEPPSARQIWQLLSAKGQHN